MGQDLDYYVAQYSRNGFHGPCKLPLVFGCVWILMDGSELVQEPAREL